MMPPLFTIRFVETVTLEVNVCTADQVLVVVKTVEAGEATQLGAAPWPLDCRSWPELPADPPEATRAPPDTTRLDEIVTACAAAPKRAALLTVTDDPKVCAWL